MLKNSSTLVFSATLLAGVLIAVSSSSWFGVWTGLELNLLSFIPLVMVNSSNAEAESGLKYFLVQACGSLVLLQSMIFLGWVKEFFYLCVLLSLGLKLGAAPMHFWFPSVAEGFSWGKVYILSTVQKVAPLTLMFYLQNMKVSSVMALIILLSGVVGALGGINEMLLRKLLSFSSINHLSWMLLSMLSESLLWMLYFFVYAFVSGSVVYILMKEQVFSLDQLSSSAISKAHQSSLLLGALSLGGLPPMLGFFPKLAVILDLLRDSSVYLAAVLLISNVITLFYYVRFSMSYVISISPKIEKEVIPSTSVSKLFNYMNVGGGWVVGVMWASLMQ